MSGWDQQGDIEDLRRHIAIDSRDDDTSHVLSTYSVSDRADVHAEQRRNRTTGLWLIVIAGVVTYVIAGALIGEPGLPDEPTPTAYHHPQPASP